MNKNVDPCDNFYEFACGGFVKKSKIPDDKPSITAFQLLDNLMKERLNHSLAEDIQPNELRAFKLTKHLYRSCINESKLQVSAQRRYIFHSFLIVSFSFIYF